MPVLASRPPVVIPPIWNWHPDRLDHRIRWYARHIRFMVVGAWSPMELISRAWPTVAGTPLPGNATPVGKSTFFDGTGSSEKWSYAIGDLHALQAVSGTTHFSMIYVGQRAGGGSGSSDNAQYFVLEDDALALDVAAGIRRNGTGEELFVGNVAIGSDFAVTGSLDSGSVTADQPFVAILSFRTDNVGPELDIYNAVTGEMIGDVDEGFARSGGLTITDVDTVDINGGLYQTAETYRQGEFHLALFADRYLEQADRDFIARNWRLLLAPIAPVFGLVPTGGAQTLVQANPVRLNVTVPAHSISGSGAASLVQSAPVGVVVTLPTHAIAGSGAAELTQASPIRLNVSVPVGAISGSGAAVLTQASPVGVVFNLPTHVISSGVQLTQAAPVVIDLTIPTASIGGSGVASLVQSAPVGLDVTIPTHVIAGSGTATLTQGSPVLLRVTLPGGTIAIVGAIVADLTFVVKARPTRFEVKARPTTFEVKE
jgi:hypothetical protein